MGRQHEFLAAGVVGRAAITLLHVRSWKGATHGAIDR
jgi:hypothetical protein